MKKYLFFIFFLMVGTISAQTSYNDDCHKTYRSIQAGYEKIPVFCTSLNKVTVTEYYVKYAVLTSMNIKVVVNNCNGFPPGTIREPAPSELNLDPIMYDIVRSKITTSSSEATAMLNKAKQQGYKKAVIVTRSYSYYEYR